ncbi:MAG: DUF3341 domain-containing protein [Planctomycetes bacterium]|nr:DUF3341 domain-containing protein [Planctomycetota bacterium]
MTRRQLVGYFEEDSQVVHALRICRERGLETLDVVSPFPLHGIDEALGLRRTRLPWLTLIGGSVGLALGMALQYWSSASDWPLNVGGKPFNSFPAFVPVAFELTILGAGLCTVFGLLARTGLHPWRRVGPERLRTSDDRIALVVARRDASHDPRELRQVLFECGAVEVVEEELP